MKIFALPVLAAALALAACDSSAPEAEDTMATDTATGTTTVIETPGPTATETVVVDDGDMTDDAGNSVTIDGADVDATIDEDGVDIEVE